VTTARAVFLLAHGTPDSLGQMPEYLARVRGGRPPSRELIAEMTANYRAIGGRSPLTDINRVQADALRHELGDDTPVYVGMRNWRPFIADVVRDAVAAGARELVGLPLAPQFSTVSVARYRDALREAAPEGVVVRCVESWHDHPGLIAAFAEKVAAAAPGRADVVVFTAHSLPVRVIEAGDPYGREVERTAALVAKAAGLVVYERAFQSAGRTPEPWLGPSVEEALRAMHDRGATSVLVVPIGFVSDHTEILFDLDVQAAREASRLGLAFRRTESLNTSPVLIRALADLVRAAG
jgi:protoporphyrin/coproporphyrin ferrochelatase